MKDFDEIVSDSVVEKRVVKPDSRDAGDGSEHYVFDAWLGCGGHCHRLAVAAETGGDPENIEFSNRLTFRCSGGVHVRPKAKVRTRLRMVVVERGQFGQIRQRPGSGLRERTRQANLN